jgi:type II secretion system protein G
MEKKKNAWRLYSLRTILGFRNSISNFLGKSSSSKLSQGFTLIEILITIGIIGILAAGLISIINPAAQYQRTNDARRKSDLSQIQKALEAYYQDIGSYPASSNYLIVVRGGNSVTWGSAWLPYMGTLPKDPRSPTREYVYYSTSDGQTYYIYASLERGSSDPQACRGSNGACAGPPGGVIDMQTACGEICNYGVSTPNVSP